MNPEFQRNLWLEAGPRRLAWAGVSIAALCGAAVLVDGDAPMKALGIAGWIIFAVSALLWGPRVAGRAVGEEVAQRTWDFQRLSALTPWEMAWGKLFGATSLAWATALIGLLLALVSMLTTGGEAKLAVAALSGLAAAVLLQAGSMTLALIGVRRARAEGRNAAFRFTFGGFIGLVVVGTAIGRVAPTGGARIGGPLEWLSAGAGDVLWWGAFVPNGWFLALSLTAFAAWALVGAWRLMRLELQMRNLPWAWPGFVLFSGVWAAGMVGPEVAMRFAAAGMVFAACAYAAAFAEPADRVGLRQFVDALKRHDLTAGAYVAPLVTAPVALAVLAVIGLALSGASVFSQSSGWVGVAALAFLARDLGIVAYFRFGPRPARGDFGAVLGLFLAYFVGGIAGRALGGETGLALFAPYPPQAAISAAAGGVMAVLVWVLAWNRIRTPEGK